MFSAMMRMRPDCAFSPEAAMLSDFRKSMARSPAAQIGSGSALADRDLQSVEAFLVERRGKLIIRLVVAGLQHLLLEIDLVPARADLEALDPTRVGSDA